MPTGSGGTTLKGQYNYSFVTPQGRWKKHVSRHDENVSIQNRKKPTLYAVRRDTCAYFVYARNSAGSNAVKNSTVARPAIRNDGQRIEITRCMRGISILLLYRIRILFVFLFVRQTVYIGSQQMNLSLAQKFAMCWHVAIAAICNTVDHCFL